MPEEFNPFAAPASTNQPEPAPLWADSEAEAVRRAHLGREATVRAVGLGCGLISVVLGLYTLLAVAIFVGAIARMIGYSGFSGDHASEAILTAILSFILAALTVGTFTLSRGLRRLRSRSRRASVVVLSIFLMILAAGALVSPFVGGTWKGPLAAFLYALAPFGMLWLLRSPKGRMIFTPEYRDVLEKTPHLRYRASKRLKYGLLCAFLLIVLLIAIGAMLGRLK